MAGGDDSNSGGKPQGGAKGNYANAPVVLNFPAGFPGQNDMVAKQMAAGFGGDPRQYQQHMADIYKPSQVMSLREPIMTTQANMQGGSYLPISTGNPVLDQLLNRGGSTKALSPEDEKKKRQDFIMEQVPGHFLRGTR